MVPVFDLSRQWQTIKKEVKEEMDKVLDSQQYILGSAVQEFEEQFANWNNSKYCIGTSSGSAALDLSLLALELPPGSKVLVPTLTYQATVLAVIHNGLIPVFVDSDPYYGISLRDAEEKIDQWTRAIIPVHLYGQPINVNRVEMFVTEHDLWLIEDCAQSHGVTFEETKVGNFGVAGCFSFYPGKNLGACGDAGAIITNSEKYYKKLRALRNDGRWDGKKYQHDLIGYNYRLDSLQAAILKVKLKYLDRWNKRRQEIAKIYDILLNSLYLDIKTPQVRENCIHVYHQYVIRVKNRDEVQKKLLEKNIQTGIHYPIPCHLQPSLQEYNKNDCPTAEQYCREFLSLPIFPEMTDEEVIEVVNKLKEALRNE